MAPGRPWHRRREVLRMLRKISLTGYRGGDLDVRRLAGTQPEAQRIEYLTIAEPAEPGCIVRRQVARARSEARLGAGRRSAGPDLEFVLGLSQSRQPSVGGRVIVATAVAFTAGVAHYEFAPAQHLFVTT